MTETLSAPLAMNTTQNGDSPHWVAVRCPSCNKKLCDRPREAKLIVTEIPTLEQARLAGWVTKCRCARLYQFTSG